MATFVEAVEELKHEPFFSEDDKSILRVQGAERTAIFGDRFHFRSALVTFRRVWLKEEASNFHYICNLIGRFEGFEFWLEMVRDQHKTSTEMRWGKVPLTSGEVVDLWLNAVFAHTNIRRTKKPQWRDRIDFGKFVQAHGHDFLEFICRTTVRSVGTAYFNLLQLARSSLARWEKEYGVKPEFQIGAPFGRAHFEKTAAGHAVIRAPSTEHLGNENERQRFERILARDRFRSLKPILICLEPDPDELAKCVRESGSYDQALAGLGYSIELRDDSELRQNCPPVGPEHRIRAVLPWLDIGTDTTHITLVGFEATVITTRTAVEFFNRKFVELKQQWAA